MVEGRTGDRDAELGHVGEVGLALLAGDVKLAEDDLTLGAVHGLPGTDAALEGAAPSRPVVIGMQPVQFLAERDRPQPRHGFQERHHVRGPDGVDGMRRCRTRRR